VLTVPAVFLLGRLAGGRRTGLLAAILTAVSRFHIWWSQELRMYVLSGLLGTLSLYLFLRWLTCSQTESESEARHAGDRLLALYVAATLGALYTIYLSAAWVLVENLVMLVVLLFWKHPRRPRLLGRWVLAQLAIGLGLGLWLAFSWGRMSTWSSAMPASPWFVARLYGVLLTAGVSVDIDRYLWTLALPTLTCVVGGALLASRSIASRDGREGVALLTLLLSVVLPPVVVYLSTLPRSLFYTPHLEARYLLPFAPAFYVLLAWATNAIAQRWKAAGTIVACGLVASWLSVLPGHYADRYLRDDYQTMVRAIISQAEPGDVVLLDSGSRYPLFLYPFESFPPAERPAFAVITAREAPLTREEIDLWLAQHGEQYVRVWLAEVDVHLSDPQRLVRQALSEHFQLAWSEGYGANALFLFSPERRAPRLDSGYRPARLATDEALGLGLRGWDVPVPTWTPASPAWLTLYWDRVPADPVRLDLVNPQGVVAYSRAVGLGEPGFPLRERIEFPISSALARGSYQVQMRDDQGRILLVQKIEIAGTPDLPMPAGPAMTVGAIMADGIALDGYTLPQAPSAGSLVLRPGDQLLVDLYWRATQEGESEWVIFTHLTGQAYNPTTLGPLWGQHDSIPAEGRWPTSTWHPGDAGIDRHVLTIDPLAPPGEYLLYVGMYDSTSGQRAIVQVDGSPIGDQLSLATPIRLVAP